jgi:hypothetical protein
MRKKLTNGEKRELRLRYLRRCLIRSGKIPKGTALKECRGSLEEHLEEKDLKKKKNAARRKRKIKRTLPSKKQRRKTRKCLKAKFTRAIQLAKKARRERRKTYEQEKSNRFKENQNKRLQGDEDSRQVPNVHEKLPSPEE